MLTCHSDLQRKFLTIVNPGWTNSHSSDMQLYVFVVYLLFLLTQYLLSVTKQSWEFTEISHSHPTIVCSRCVNFITSTIRKEPATCSSKFLLGWTRPREVHPFHWSSLLMLNGCVQFVRIYLYFSSLRVLSVLGQDKWKPVKWGWSFGVHD